MSEREELAVHIAGTIAKTLDELASPLRNSRELMNAKEAAEFLNMPQSEFRRIAPELARLAISDRRFVYLRSELLEWVLSR